ncbi:hypothetical protein PoB_005585300 [Plakobranchus ocellatus]|uniref:Uncharacterized protein n=1 Tax=Plakobranchus ocellatus TaxID=259542 RepID=A0AAV4CBV5_9GAST|nr:hypothetical protein PoB_005585300 [Plakobranchus ocellatus]
MPNPHWKQNEAGETKRRNFITWPHRKRSESGESPELIPVLKEDTRSVWTFAVLSGWWRPPFFSEVKRRCLVSASTAWLFGGTSA